MAERAALVGGEVTAGPERRILHGPGDGAGMSDGVVRVVVADDQTVVREGLVTLLGLVPGIEVVGAAADGAEACALVAEHDPDVALLDLRMPGVGRCRGDAPDPRAASAAPRSWC